MSELTSKQRKYLRSKAHSLRPLVLVGKDGVSEGVIEEVKLALLHHELIKIKFVEGKEEREELTRRITESTESLLAGTIGNISILFKEHPEVEKRQFSLPQ